MPQAPTFPGVYIEEIPSGVRTIVGVATNIAAFIGRAVAGPVNQPVVINSFADFQRRFGGLAVDYPMSYAVNDFYQNGGSQAIIVRLASSAVAATFDVGGLALTAASPGTWGNSLQARVDKDNITDDVARRYGLTVADLFNLTVSQVVDGQTVSQERFLSLSAKPDGPKITPAGRAQRVDRVLSQSSQLVRVPVDATGNAILPSSAPGASSGQPGGSSSSAGPGGSSSSSGSGGSSSSSSSSSSSPAGSSSSSGGSSSSSGGPALGTDGGALGLSDFQGDPSKKTGIHALDTADLFNLLCIPPDTQGGSIDPSVYSTALDYCVKRRAMLILDAPADWSRNPANGAADALTGLNTFIQSVNGDRARNGALYFPRVREADPLVNGTVNTYAPCGIVAGIMARTDVTRGVWKAPAGIDASLNGVVGLDVTLTNEENGQLNPLGINCLRSFAIVGSVVWGARTLRGADMLADEYKYVPVRRVALFIEESLYRGTQWVVFEPNDEPLWSQIRLNVGAFMHNLFVQGAFQGQTPSDAYFVRCDKNTTTQNEINLGIVNIVVGFAPLKPAEFVIIKIQQIAGAIAT
jgi:phage tail sheath protein FI